MTFAWDALAQDAAPAAPAPAQNGSYPAQQAYPEQQAYPQPAPGTQPAQPAQGYPPPQQQPGYDYQQQPGYQAQPGYAQPAPAYAPYAAPPPYSMGPVPGSNPEFMKMTTPQLESELDDTGLGGPITFLAIGVPALLIGVPWFIGSVIGASSCESIDSSYYFDDTCDDAYTASLILSGTLIGVGLPFTILGSILLPKRISKRRALSNEIELRTNYGKTAFDQRRGP
jgi:hypothetical protein